MGLVMDEIAVSSWSDEGKESDEWRRYWRMMTVAKGEI
jgi:hypothetical protein